MRALSRRQATRCEDAKHPHCRCRCGGAFHGASRIFTSVEITDPHAPAFYSREDLKRARRTPTDAPLPSQA